MKKKICKKYLAWMLAVAMLLTGIPVQHIQAAQAVKLSNKRFTLTVGTSKIITLKNNKKKTRWKIVSGKNCIRLKNKKKSSVMIAAVKSGKAKVQAKDGKKKYTCIVIVKDETASYVTETPNAASILPVTQNPVASQNPVKTNNPVATDNPTATPNPGTTGTPTTTNDPAATSNPTTTNDPAASDNPAATSNPGTTGNPITTNTPTTTDNPTTTSAPGTKNKNDVSIIQNIIQEQRQKGATVSEDLDNDQYLWENGRLTRINWSKQNLQGELDFSGLESLTGLDCRNNQLNSLDVSKNVALTSLNCWNNQLNTLDVSKNVALTMLHCRNNRVCEKISVN